MTEPCRQCGSPLERADATGVTFLWPDETPFDPQPEEWRCTNPECTFGYLKGLTQEQADRLMGLRQPVGRFRASSEAWQQFVDAVQNPPPPPQALIDLFRDGA